MKPHRLLRLSLFAAFVGISSLASTAAAQTATADKPKSASSAADKAKAEAAAREKQAVALREAAIRRFADKVDARFNQPYAGNDNPKQQVDVYLPKQPADDKPLPVVVFIHGGGWSGGDRKSYVAQAMTLVSGGKYAAVAVGYRLSGEVKWPAQIHDCKAAIRYIRGHAKQWNIDPEKIGVTGTSAGGHLVTLLGVSAKDQSVEGAIGDFTSLPSHVTAVVNFCGPSDFTAPLMKGEAAKVDDPAVAGVLGGKISEHLDAAHQASPVWHLNKKVVPMLAPLMIVHGTDDSRVDFKHAEMLDAAMKKAGGDSLLIAMQGAGHGIPTGPELAGRIMQFWDMHLRGVKSEISSEPIKVTPPPATK